MMKRLALFTSLALLVARLAWAVATCTISGVVYDAAGSPLANAVITFNTLYVQVVSSNTINQTLISATTDSAGNLTPISLAQGVYVQITVNGGAPVTAIVPFSSTATFSSLISNIVANPSLTELDLIGQVVAPTCQAGNGVLYYDSVLNRFMISSNCSSFQPIVTPSSTDTLTNKSIAAGQLTGIPDCQDTGGNHLNYTLSTTTFSCGTTSSGGGGGGSNPQSDAVAILFNNSDITKLIRFDLSGLTTATTRTYLAPDRGGTITMATTSGTLTSGNVAKFDASGNIVDGGAVPGGKFGLLGRTPSTMPNNAVSYIPISGITASSATISDVYMALPFAGRALNLHCFVKSTPTGGSYAFALTPISISPPSPTCTITDPATSCDDLVRGEDLVANQLVAIQVTPSSLPTAREGGCSIEIDPS